DEPSDLVSDTPGRPDRDLPSARSIMPAIHPPSVRLVSTNRLVPGQALSAPWDAGRDFVQPWRVGIPPGSDETTHRNQRRGELPMSNEHSTEKVQAQERRRYEAMLAGDLATLQSLCHPRLIYSHSNAERDTRESWI